LEQKLEEAEQRAQTEKNEVWFQGCQITLSKSGHLVKKDGHLMGIFKEKMGILMGIH
jgi:hypothetical protein